MDTVFVILLDRLDAGHFPSQRKIHDIPSGAGPEPDAAPRAEFDSVHDHALRRGPVQNRERVFQDRECLYRECLYRECLYRECLYRECLYRECLYRECLYRECLYRERLGLRVQNPEIPDGAMQVHEILRIHRLGPLQYLPRAGVRGAHLRLLLIRQREDVQQEQLINLPAVEVVSLTFRRDLRVVIENNRRGKERVRFPLLPAQHRPRLDVLALRGGLFQRRGRVHQGDESPVLDRQNRVRRDEGLPERGPAFLSAPRRGVGDAHRQPEQARFQWLRFDLHQALKRAPASHQCADNLATLGQRLLFAPVGNRDLGAVRAA